MNDRLLKALAREPTDATPVWIMRQAGRYLPEYREIRKRHELFEMMTTPEIAARATLLPVERFDLDAAVLFSDLSLPLIASGLDVRIEPEVGPVIGDPVRSPDDVDLLRIVDVERDLGFVFEEVRILRKELRVPLVGFAGAPFTLATYAIEGRGGRDMAKTREFMVKYPAAWARLMSYYSDLVSRFLLAQAGAGAGAVQLFDSWVGVLSPETYRRQVLPHSRAVFAALAAARVPSIHFGTGNPELYPLMREAGGDCIGIDWRIGLDEAWKRVGHDVAIQGNLDPVAMLGDAGHVEAKAREVLERAAGRPGHVFNLGHGILPATPVENVEKIIETVHSWRPPQ